MFARSLMSLGKTKIKEDYQRPPVLTSDGDASTAFSFQFGSPDLDEQKRDQAPHDSSFRSVPNLPTSVTKQQVPGKDSVAADQPDSGVALKEDDEDFQPGQGGNFVGLRNPRAQTPLPYFGGIRPMQSMDPQGGMPRNSPDADRWQRAVNRHQKGLLPSPQTPLQMMHKADEPDSGVALKEDDEDFQPGQGGNFVVLRNPRAQIPLPNFGGILAGPMQSMDPQGGMPRNSPDADRWQRAANRHQKGLLPSPQTPLQMMHKAEKKYEVGKVGDEEESKQRQLRAILNKLTPQNFEKLFEQVKTVNIDNAVTLTGFVSQIYDRALMEPTFCEMYANLCYRLPGELRDFSEDNEKITFKRLLLNKCQEDFERREREQEQANKVEEEGKAKQSEEEREEKRIKARRRMLGNIRLIGELYKKKMLTERIMHECIKKLLGEYENPDEEDVEALCILMSTIGEMIDHPKAKVYVDAYFERMAKLSNNMKLSPRVRFKLKDAIDLRKNKWQQRPKVEGPSQNEGVYGCLL
ncbi:hypothetical protein DITRI_Ditri13aG0009500 [Diplodiscus trichospermus]